MGVLVIVGFRSGSNSGAVTVALLLLFVIGISSGLLPGLGVVAGFNDESVELSLESGETATTSRDGVSIGQCTWEPATGKAFFTIANRGDVPVKAKADVVFGEARRNRAPMQIDGRETYPADGKSWLLPPDGLPNATQPDYSPAWTIRVDPPSSDEESRLITWCYATIASVERV